MSEPHPQGSDDVSAPPTPYINQRLSFDHKRCTVRYIGPVAGTSGIWLGVEWDNPEHGKHNGTHNGVQYFTCRSASDHAASFIRSTRALRQRRVAFLDAVQDRYVPDSARMGNLFEGTQERIRFGRKIVEEVGFDKIAAEQAELRKIRIVGVERTGIVGVSLSDDPETRSQCSREIRDTLIRVEELDLSANLLERWRHVAEIVGNMRALRLLKISGNRFADLEESDVAACRDAFGGISTLWMEDILSSWSDITTLIQHFTQLQKLHLGWNELQTIPTPLIAPNLGELSLARNGFTSLSSLAPLSSLPTLTKLVLEGNQINDLSSPPIFPHLTFLDLASNLLPSFTSLNPLATTSFPSLTSLRLSRNPFFTAVPADVAQMLSMARIPQVDVLDYSTISTAERNNAELYYLSRIADALKDTARNSADERRVLIDHPQWDNLCTKHDYTPAVPRAGDDPPPTFAPGTLGARLVTLHIRRQLSSTSLDATHKPGMTTTMLKVPRSISIYALKAAVGRLFGLRPARFRLVWETGEWDPVGGRGDEDEFSVESGSESDGEREDGHRGEQRGGKAGKEEEKQQGRFVRREVHVVEGTSSVGFWIDGADAMLRLEEVEFSP